MNDRELMWSAAMAAGYTLGDVTIHRPNGWAFTKGGVEWNPLTNDADAFRLGIDVGLRFGTDGQSFNPCIHCWMPNRSETSVVLLEGDDKHAAARRAITQAAAMEWDRRGRR